MIGCPAGEIVFECLVRLAGVAVEQRRRLGGLVGPAELDERLRLIQIGRPDGPVRGETGGVEGGRLEDRELGQLVVDLCGGLGQACLVVRFGRGIGREQVLELDTPVVADELSCAGQLLDAGHRIFGELGGVRVHRAHLDEREHTEDARQRHHDEHAAQ